MNCRGRRQHADSNRAIKVTAGFDRCQGGQQRAHKVTTAKINSRRLVKIPDDFVAPVLVDKIADHIPIAPIYGCPGDVDDQRVRLLGHQLELLDQCVIKNRCAIYLKDR